MTQPPIFYRSYPPQTELPSLRQPELQVDISRATSHSARPGSQWRDSGSFAARTTTPSVTKGNSAFHHSLRTRATSSAFFTARVYVCVRVKTCGSQLFLNDQTLTAVHPAMPRQKRPENSACRYRPRASSSQQLLRGHLFPPHLLLDMPLALEKYFPLKRTVG